MTQLPFAPGEMGLHFISRAELEAFGELLAKVQS